MSKFDPPSDPYGGERLCRVCDRPLEYNPLTRQQECTRDHDAPEMAECSECCQEFPVDTLRPDPQFPQFKICPTCMAHANLAIECQAPKRFILGQTEAEAA